MKRVTVISETEMSLGLRICLTLGGSVVIASTGLLMRAAEVKGQVLFDPVEATLYAEMIKLTATIAWAFSSPLSTTPIPVYSPRLWLTFAPAAIGYFVVNNVRFELIRVVNPGLLSVLWNLKVVVIAALYSLPPIRRRLTGRQWLGASLLVLGTTAAQFSEFKLAKGANSGGLEGFTFVILTLVLTSASAVACEFAYKTNKLPLRFQNLVMYTEGCILNYCTLLIRHQSPLHQRRQLSLASGFSGWTWSVVLAQACAGYAVGAIFKYIDAIGQVVADVLAVVVSTIVSVLFFNLEVDLHYVASLFVSLFAIVVYYSPYKRWRHCDLLVERGTTTAGVSAPRCCPSFLFVEVSGAKPHSSELAATTGTCGDEAIKSPLISDTPT